MIEDFSQLRLEYAIFHRVFAPTKEGRTPPRLSPQYIKFDESNIKNSLFLKDQIIKALNHYAVNISIDTNSASTTPTSIIDLFSKFSNGELKENVKTDAFLNHSFSMAHNLDMSQDERSTSGVLCVMYGNVEGKQVIIIAKLEEGQDLQIQEMKENDVFIRLDIKIVDNIVRLNKTNVLKVGIFYKEPKKPGSSTDYEIKSYLCDTQNLERKSADYYLKKFLGCLYTHDPKFQTQEFYNAAFDFISTHIEDPREQVLYRDHLYSYLLSQKTIIEPKNFIQTYFPADKKMATELENQFKSKNIELNGFPKDTEHVRKQVEKMKVLFENGVTLMGASANFASEVIIDSCDENGTKLTVKSKISKMPLKVTRKRTVKSKTSEEE